MQSRCPIERVVKKLKARIAAFSPETGRISAWRKALHLEQQEPPSMTRRWRRPRCGSSLLTSRIVEIYCDSLNPKLAAQFANTLADEYITRTWRAAGNRRQKTGEFLTRQIAGPENPAGKVRRRTAGL